MSARNNIQKGILISIFMVFFTIACSSNKGAVKDIPSGEVELLFKKANEMISAGDFEVARQLLERVKAEDTTQDFAPTAQIRIADTYFQEDRYEEAEVEYEVFLSRYPYHRYASYAQYRLGMTYFKRIKSVDVSYSMAKKALEAFEKLLIQYPRNPYIEVTEGRIKACRNILAEYELYVGKFYFKKGSYGAASQRFEVILKDYPDSKPEAEALYYLGLSYRNMGERGKAIDVLNTLIERFPRIKLSREAKEIIASLNKKQ